MPTRRFEIVVFEMLDYSQIDNCPSASENCPMVSQDLLDMLVCPVCKRPLALKDEGQSLKCGECHRVYPIRDDIPILLVDEAVTEPS
ncbi:MAG TPA: Trm112 family protein [Terriglobales bacterium]|nr:Trm112 family protein [Terriglobales bacterium]